MSTSGGQAPPLHSLWTCPVPEVGVLGARESALGVHMRSCPLKPLGNPVTRRKWPTWRKWLLYMKRGNLGGELAPTLEALDLPELRNTYEEIPAAKSKETGWTRKVGSRAGQAAQRAPWWGRMGTHPRGPLLVGGICSPQPGQGR